MTNIASTRPRVIAYLSGAPRVSTRPTAELAGPRAHVLGTLGALTELGCEVRPFIYADQVPKALVSNGSEDRLQKSGRRLIAIDLLRILIGIVNAQKARTAAGHGVDAAYERLASFQALGHRFSAEGIPWILESNAPVALEGGDARKTLRLKKLAGFVERRAYRSADIVVAVSEKLRELIITQYQVNPEQVIVVPNGVDIGRFNREKQIKGPGPYRDSLVIGFAGNIVEWQGLDVLIQAVHILNSPKDNLITVRVIGDGAALSDLRRFVHDLKMDDRVEFIGRVRPDVVPTLVAGFDLAYSGQSPVAGGDAMYHSPLKLYEYAAMAVPLLASRYPDAEGLVGANGERGFLFDPGNVESLTEVLRDILGRRNELPQMGSDLRDEVCANHTWSVRYERLLTQISAVITRPRRFRLLGIDVEAVDLHELNKLVEVSVSSRKRSIIANHNMHSAYLHRKDNELRRFYASVADRVHIDGMGLVLTARLLGLPITRGHRTTYADWIGPLLELCSANNFRVFTLGSKDEVVREAHRILRTRYPELCLDGMGGYFDTENHSSSQAVRSAIEIFNPDVLLVGMGMPRQERWILQNSGWLEAPVILTSGACLDYIAGAARTPPRWASGLSVEWLFRLATEPRRLWYRYLVEPWALLPLLVSDVLRTRLGI